MSYPNVVYLQHGREKVAQSAKIGNLPLGQLMVLPDGRKFRHAQAGSATDLEAGVVVGASASVVGHGGISGSGLTASATATNNAAGDTNVVLLTKSAAVTKDQYAGGMLNVVGPAGSTYIGQNYKIKSNKSAAVSSKLEITLEPNDGLKVAFAAVTTVCSLSKGAHAEAIVQASAPIGPVIGATPVAVTKSYYFWAQRSGPASLQQAVTVCTAGEAVMVGAEAGSVTLAIAGSVINGGYIGQAMEQAAASQAIQVNMDLE